MKKWRAKKDDLPKELRDVLLGKAPGVYTEVEFLKVCTEQPEKEDAPTVWYLCRCDTVKEGTPCKYFKEAEV